ncbi:MAG TPA: DUF502 domain-containing protein [Burkholderiales bacterium]|nr:DUF502 domain-containing protein [Burkholderiales bacterium]
MKTEPSRPSRGFIFDALISGLLVIVPFYLAVLLLLKAMQSLVGLVRPLAALLPDWLPAEDLLSLLLLLVLCFLVGVALRTRIGRSAREGIEKALFQRIPGYALFRGLAQQVSGESRGSTWKPALIETGDGLVPGFIIEELDDGQLTVFVPSVPTPLAGAVLVLPRERVHPLDVPFTSAIQVISKWGSGSKALVAAMKTAKA